MAKHVLMALNGAVPGQEAEFERWYDEVHIPEILAVPCFVAARRFHIVNTNLQGGETWSSVSIYDFETDDPASILAEAGRRMGNESMPSTPALDSPRTIAYIATPLV